MKRSTKVKWSGFLFFMIGSVLVQQYIEPLFYAGGLSIWIGMMFIDAQLSVERHEKNMEELDVLHKKIEASLQNMQKLGESDEKSDDSDYFDKKRSQTDKEK